MTHQIQSLEMVRGRVEEVEEEGNPQPVGESGARVMDPDMPCTEVVPLPSLKFANDNMILPYDNLNMNEILQINDAVPQQKEYTTFQQWAHLHTDMGKIMREIAVGWSTALTGICGNITRSDWAHSRNLI